MCSKYEIIPDDNFINENIVNNEYFTGFMKNFIIMKKINGLFNITNDTVFESSLAKYLLLGCSNISRNNENQLEKIKSKYILRNILSNLYNTDKIHKHNL